MPKIPAEEIKNFPIEYKKMMEGSLSKRQIELLDGASIKSHEGMVFGGMYADWKRRKGYDVGWHTFGGLYPLCTDNPILWN